MLLRVQISNNMYFGQFNKKLSEQKVSVGIKSQLRSFDHLIEETIDGNILIDHESTKFKSLEEARQHIVQHYNTELLEQEIAQDIYEEISDIKIADIIKEHHNIKVTDTLIESYVELASSKIFTVDPVAADIRNLNKFDKLIENKIDFKLNDGSIVAINKDTQNYINNLLQNHNEIVEHMRENKENFLSVIKQIEE